uniref:Integrator complex subunit 5 n=1 Tax=Heterorhabditis bacteriophora TaxID=37862 RepID=A0A1I7WZJ4_HETBA
MKRTLWLAVYRWETAGKTYRVAGGNCNLIPTSTGISHERCLIDTLLDNILQNVTNQKDNCEFQYVLISAAAWLETLVDVADRVSLISLKQYILSNIRYNFVFTWLIYNLFFVFRNTSDTVSLLLPCFIQLCKDEDNTVKETCMNNIAQCIPYLTKDAKKTTIIPLIKKSTEQSLEKKDDILVVIAKNLGEWSYSLRDVLDQLDMCWVLNSYCKIVSLSQTTGENPSAQSMLTMCRRMSAFNFPVHLSLLCFSLTDDEVRMAMASSFHEVLSVHSDRSNLIPAFIELIRGGALEVVAKQELFRVELLQLIRCYNSCVSNQTKKKGRKSLISSNSVFFHNLVLASNTHRSLKICVIFRYFNIISVLFTKLLYACFMCLLEFNSNLTYETFLTLPFEASYINVIKSLQFFSYISKITNFTFFCFFLN